MTEKIYFYQNNPCVITRIVNDDFAEIMLSHKFAQDMQTRGQCQGCCVGDSDNKLQCTCDEFSWIIEEVQEEENKVICMVERRLLADHPIEKVAIDKLQKSIADENNKLAATKVLHQEWTEHLNGKREEYKALEAKSAALRAENEALVSQGKSIESRFSGLMNQYHQISVVVDKYRLKPIEITNKEYQELLKRNKILSALEAGGVDNWEWYDESLKDIKED